MHKYHNNIKFLTSSLILNKWIIWIHKCNINEMKYKYQILNWLIQVDCIKSYEKGENLSTLMK